MVSLWLLVLEVSSLQGSGDCPNLTPCIDTEPKPWLLGVSAKPPAAANCLPPPGPSLCMPSCTLPLLLRPLLTALPAASAAATGVVLLGCLRVVGESPSLMCSGSTLLSMLLLHAAAPSKLLSPTAALALPTEAISQLLAAAAAAAAGGPTEEGGAAAAAAAAQLLSEGSAASLLLQASLLTRLTLGPSPAAAALPAVAVLTAGCCAPRASEAALLLLLLLALTLHRVAVKVPAVTLLS
jgi:hypothetical protein